MEPSVALFKEKAVFDNFPVQKCLLDDRLSAARYLSMEHFVASQGGLGSRKAIEDALNAEELLIRKTNKLALFDMVYGRLKMLQMSESRPQHVTDDAFAAFETQYNDAKTWFCQVFPGFEVDWSEAVVNFIQNWVSKAGVQVHLAEATEAYLAAIGAKETRVLLQALDDQRSELLFLRRSQTKYGCLTPMTFEELEASCFDE